MRESQILICLLFGVNGDGTKKRKFIPFSAPRSRETTNFPQFASRAGTRHPLVVREKGDRRLVPLAGLRVLGTQKAPVTFSRVVINKTK